MKENKNVPKLRFNEFSENWEFKNLEQVSIVKDGTHDSPKYIDEGYPLVTSKNLLKNGKIDLNDVNYISKKDFDDINKRSNVSNGDILFGMIGTIGNPVIVNGSNFAIKNVALIKEKKLLKNNFLIYILQTDFIRKQFYKLNAGGTQKFIALGLIRNLIVPLPTIKEQIKIVNFLSLIDKKIELLEKKLSLYQYFTVTLKNKIFTSDYEEKFVGNYLKESKIISKSDDINKRLTVKLNLKGVVPRELKSIEKEGVTTQYIRKSGQFIYGKQNLFKGSFGIIPEELNNFLSSSDLPSFDFNKNIDPYWFYFYFSRKNFYTQLESLSTGTGSKRISPKEFLKIKINIPDLKKQKQISELFKKIEIKHKLYENSLTLMKIYKKGLLQKMFIN